MINYDPDQLNQCLKAGLTEDRSAGEIHVCCHFCDNPPQELPTGPSACCNHVPGGPPERWPEQIRRLPRVFHSHSLDELARWIEPRYSGPECLKALCEEIMRETRFTEGNIEDIESQYYRQTQTWKMRRIRELATAPSALRMFETAPRALAWNPDNVLVFNGRGAFDDTTYGEYGATLSDFFAELISPDNHPQDDYIRLMRSDVRSLLV